MSSSLASTPTPAKSIVRTITSLSKIFSTKIGHHSLPFTAFVITVISVMAMLPLVFIHSTGLHRLQHREPAPYSFRRPYATSKPYIPQASLPAGTRPFRKQTDTQRHESLGLRAHDQNQKARQQQNNQQQSHTSYNEQQKEQETPNHTRQKQKQQHQTSSAPNNT